MIVHELQLRPQKQGIRGQRSWLGRKNHDSLSLHVYLGSVD